jgi:DNA-directed RNA polymerase subunit RPC12/RpoP
MRLLKCPACGGPLDSPAGESSMKCPYCGNQVVIPEDMRKPAPGAATASQSIFSGIDMGAMIGYGAQWSEIVQMAQSGKKDEAVKRYVALTGQSESDALRMVDGLGGYQSYEFIPGTYSVQQIYAPAVTEAYKTAGTVTKSVTRMTMWLTCGIFAFVFFIIIITTLPVLIGVFASFASFLR